MNPPVIVSRTDATARGLKLYFTGVPCKRGHMAMRLVRNGECLECKKHGKRVYNVKNPHTATVRNLRRNNPQSLIPLTEREQKQLHAVYLDRNERTETTGLLHHVDHAWPLSRGGVHHPLNLQVLVAEDNVEKGVTADLSHPSIIRGFYCSLFGHERSKRTMGQL